MINLLASPAGDEVDQAGGGAGGRSHELVGLAGGVTPEVWPLHQPGTRDTVLLLALPPAREGVPGMVSEEAGAWTRRPSS